LTDLQNDQRSLRVGLVEERGIITSAYVTLRPQAQLDPGYLNYFLKNMDFRKDFYALGAGVRQSLKFDELRTIKVPLPPLAEQRASRPDVKEFGSPWLFEGTSAHAFTNEVHHDHLHVGVYQEGKTKG